MYLSYVCAGSRPNLASLASSLATKARSRLQLLELLCTNPNASTQQQQQQFYHQGGSQQQGNSGSGGRRGISSSSNGSADIRRFCGVSELHKASLCVVAAALHAGDICWGLGDVLTATDAAVGHAGPAMLSQPELLLSITRLYAQVEQQLLLDLQQQEVLQLQAAERHGYSSQAPAAAAASLPPPAAIVHVLGKMSAAQLSVLRPDDAAAEWLLGQAAVLPGAVRLLLLHWMQLLLLPPPAATSSTAAASGQAADAGSVQQQWRKEQQQNLVSGLLSALQQQPAAVSTVLQLVEDCLQPQQQQQQRQAAAWLAVLGSLLTSSSNSVAGAVRSQQWQQEMTAGAEGSGRASVTLLSLLLGSQANADTDAAGGGLRAQAGCSLLLLTCKVLASAGWDSSWGCCYLLFACSSCLIAVAAAVASEAAAAVCAQAKDAEQRLMQQGIQQVRRAMCCRAVGCADLQAQGRSVSTA